MIVFVAALYALLLIAKHRARADWDLTFTTLKILRKKMRCSRRIGRMWQNILLLSFQVVLGTRYEEILVQWPTPQRQRETLAFGTCSTGCTGLV
ncbi:uncharacterized protein EV420DRAFT_1532623 [Desarmillaria tabescens]|uniref:Secreted protein n=1 Tax=Armillaria tabescens TaxID=1929756 RepID=A0AA39N7M0_ARMTA|nr:uncharacterized protein EV420DRAFT_1532623 [Desarmillaria tabescens]KAK0460518.1 hypothetical protein EV420DRAFT_1532623 [Desarmillaria tabescens]